MQLVALAMRLKPDENNLTGAWLIEGDRVISDEVCRRIGILVEEYLQLIGSADECWSKLYLDPEDGRYWELVYPQGEMHGGGLPQLVYISADAAKIRYVVN
jgi:Immunity protein 27